MSATHIGYADITVTLLIATHPIVTAISHATLTHTVTIITTYATLLPWQTGSVLAADIRCWHGYAPHTTYAAIVTPPLVTLIAPAARHTP